MARTYAGILGLLAFVTSLVRGILAGRPDECDPVDCLVQPAGVCGHRMRDRLDRRANDPGIGARTDRAELAGRKAAEGRRRPGQSGTGISTSKDTWRGISKTGAWKHRHGGMHGNHSRPRRRRATLDRIQDRTFPTRSFATGWWKCTCPW